MGILGYFPGTSVAAICDDSKDTIFGVLAWMRAQRFSRWFSEQLLKRLDLERETLATMTGVTPWAYIVALTIISIALFKWVDRLEARNMKDA